MALEKIKEIIQKIGGKEPEKEYADDETRDKYLRSLRRQDRIQNEEVEKEMLINKIRDFNRARTRKHLFGVKEKLEAKKSLLDKIEQKKVNILEKRKSLFEENSLLDNKKDEFKKKKVNILSDNSSFLGKGFI